ncbi:MAG TPA: DUF1549 domain-containing protein, partial [Gemmatales bacterium]|nr:DUF1549 domain-containing protein [Gemmatales bacterium]
MILGWLCLCLFVDYASTSKIEVKLYPPTIHLHGRGARHRLLLVEEVNDQAVGQPSGDWKFESSVPETVTIVDGDIALALKDGEATISARSPTGLHITSSIHVKISGTAKEEPPGFERDVIPVLTKLTCNTGSCHGSMAGKGGLKLSLRGYDPESDYFAIARQAFQRRVDLRHPEQSLLLLKPLGLLSHGGGQKLETDTPEYETLLEWIKSGVPEHEKQPVVLKSINAYPPRIRLTPQKSMPLLVQALYSDGRTVDVARRARFASSEDQLMKVTEDGLVTAKGSGAGGVSILHGNQVALVPVVSPFESTDVKMQKLLANNFIDQHINGRLYELNLPASPVCSDQEFIRRAYIDAIGCLPTPEELDRYFQDTSQDKRSKLIDELLARPEYVDYWTNKWADLFLISTKKLPGSNVWAFHQYLKQAVADNRPWNVL